MQSETIQNCDAVIWANHDANTLMTFYKTENKVKPTELGFKYDIVIFRENEADSLEAFSAIVGDPKSYVERMGKGGYNGFMFKQKSCSKKQMKEMFSNSLKHWGFDDKEMKRAMKSLG